MPAHNPFSAAGRTPPWVLILLIMLCAIAALFAVVALAGSHSWLMGDGR